MIIKLIISALLFCILQISLVHSIAIFQTTPDLILIIVLYAALFYGEIGLWIGFGAGLFLDLYNLSLGYNALLLSLIAYGIGKLASRVYREAPILWITLIGVGSILKNLIMFAVQKELSFGLIFKYIIPEAIYTTIVGIVIFFIFKNYIFWKKAY